MGSSQYKTVSFSGMMEALAENPTRRKSGYLRLNPFMGIELLDALTRGK
jgi:hypothetical protein